MFDLVAWPVKYGIIDVKMFADGRSGIVYEADRDDHAHGC
jgi:hypothetical protein